MQFLLLITILISLTGCTSSYHVGASVLKDGGALYRPVPRKVASELKEFEEECIVAIISSDVDKIYRLATPSLARNINPQHLRLELSVLNTGFKPTNNFRKIELSDVKFWLDEMMTSDPYQVYEFIASQYDVSGNPNVQVLLLISKEKDFKLWGFSIHPYTADDKKSELTYFSKDIKGWWTFGVRPYQWWTFYDCCINKPGSQQ